MKAGSLRIFATAAFTWIATNEMTAQHIDIIVPNDRANLEGNSGQGLPFSNPNPQRYQQVYDASQFSAISEGGGLIKGVAFRDDGPCRFSFGATISNLQINLSTTPTMPDGLSSIFSENVGADDTVVFGPARSVLLLGACSPGMRPQLWAVVIGFPKPFYYDPNAGNLLLDIRNISGATSSFGLLDAQDEIGDSVSRVLGSLGSASGVLNDSFGLITLFVVQPLPRLHLSLAWTNLLFRWANYPGGWTLQQSPTVGPGSMWQLAGGIATTNGAYKEVTLPLDTNTAGMFFRLALPPQGQAVVSTGNAAVVDSNAQLYVPH